MTTLARLDSNAKMIKILEASIVEGVALNGVEYKGQGFFVIWYSGASVKETNYLHKALRTIEGLDVCKDEKGYIKGKGAFLTVKIW
jgi:hypothetical protein